MTRHGLGPSPRRRSAWRECALLPGLLTLAGILAAVPASAVATRGNPLNPPAVEIVEEARTIVEAMKTGERGPYKRIRWFCRDGTVHPPKPYPCGDRGGGNQHAEYSDARQRLAELGWHVGTVLTATSPETILDAENNHRRLRDLALEKYLIQVDDGWILRKARYYRGSVQVEDEEAAGRRLAQKMLASPDWVEEHFLLARESVRAIPHPGADEGFRTVRRLAKVTAERDPSFERLRIKIHTLPEVGDVGLVRDWLRKVESAEQGSPAIADARMLLEEMERLYGEGARSKRLREVSRELHERTSDESLSILLNADTKAVLRERIHAIATLLRSIRREVTMQQGTPDRLRLLDVSMDAETELVLLANQLLLGSALDLRRSLELAKDLAQAAHATGYLSPGERDRLLGSMDRILAQDEISSAEYLALVREMERAAAWSVGTVRYVFGESIVRFASLEPKAGHFPDDLLRGSVMLPFARLAGILARDAEALAGVRKRLLGNPVDGVAGLNAGIARGPLRVLSEEELERGVQPARNEIAVLPRTVSELTPVAGILSRDEGNVLSHVQLLARNLGIPNASLSPDAFNVLRDLAGRSVVLLVGTDGSVYLQEEAKLSEEERTSLDLGAGSMAKEPGEKVSAPSPDLSQRRPLTLDELHASLSGRVVGPKAANVGELARLFPGRVSPSVAIPFGIYAEHASGGGDDSPRSRLERAFRLHRTGELDDAGLDQELLAVREAVAALALSEGSRNLILEAMRREFGPDGTYGVFVRSDTNVEDLPGFTGAGLNETLPNVVGTDRILAGIPRVWSSPFRPRAMAWRAKALTNPEDVYPSVLLMKSSPADKSGVLVTTDLVTRGEGLTVATAWGVGGAVDGESAETLVLRPEGSVLLASEAKAPYKRRLAESGGVEWVPAKAGPVLREEERAALRQLAQEVAERLTQAAGPNGESLPWDIEFGFVSGRLVLFQIRPLVERGAARADRALARFGVVGSADMSTRIGLDRIPGGSR